MQERAILRKSVLAVSLGAALGYAPGAWAFIDIVFDYTYDSGGFFSSADSKNTLEAAAGYFESIILDDFTAIDSNADAGGSNNFTASFSDPSTGNTVNLSNFDVAANTITVFVGGSSNLGSGTLGAGGPGGYGVSGTSTFVDNAVSRGEGGGDPTAVRNFDSDNSGTIDPNEKTATDFALWGGSISFNNTTDWYFDTDTSTDTDIPNNSFDFYSVAVHELGHVLGIGTADSWNNNVDTTNGTFTGANAEAANGGTAVALADSAHWAEGTQSTVNGNTQEAAMDPTITNGQRKRFTELDKAALADIGWELQTATQ